MSDAIAAKAYKELANGYKYIAITNLHASNARSKLYTRALDSEVRRSYAFIPPTTKRIGESAIGTHCSVKEECQYALCYH
jgi:hypothetical protein